MGAFSTYPKIQISKTHDLNKVTPQLYIKVVKYVQNLLGCHYNYCWIHFRCPKCTKMMPRQPKVISWSSLDLPKLTLRVPKANQDIPKSFPISKLDHGSLN